MVPLLTPLFFGWTISFRMASLLFSNYEMWKYIDCLPTMITARGTIESREEMIQHSMAHTLQENSTCKQDNINSNTHKHTYFSEVV
jgi:hypothetical protein